MVERVVFERAHPEERRGALGDDVGRRAAIGDDPVDPHRARQLLAQQTHVHEQRDHRVERVDPALRVGSRMGGAAVEHELDLAIAEEEPVRAPHVGRVRHQRDVGVAEHPGLDQAPLAHADLLGRAADHDQAQRRAGQRRRERLGREQARGSGQVVAARVADPGQRVHLGEQRRTQRRPGVAPARDERGRHPGHARLHREAEAGEQRPIALARGALLERELRVLGHPARERERGPGGGVDRREQRALLGIGLQRRHGPPSAGSRSRL